MSRGPRAPRTGPKRPRVQSGALGPSTRISTRGGLRGRARRISSSTARWIVGMSSRSCWAQALEEARQTPGFAGLGAEQAGHVVPVDGSVWTSTGGYILMDTIVSDIESTFLK